MMEQQVHNLIVEMVVMQIDEHQLSERFVDMIVAMLVLDTLVVRVVLGMIVAMLVIDKIGAHALVYELKFVVDIVMVEL
ncbi:hypothetical protein Tco_1441780, partial [Tanacetum coccineum]